MILPEGVTSEYIELLLWAMEQTDSPNPIVRERWWEYRSLMEYPPEIEVSSICRVPFVRVSCQSELVESSSTEPNYKRRKAVGPMMLPAIVSLAVHIVSRGGCMPSMNRGDSPPPQNSLRRSLGLSVFAGCELCFVFQI